MIDYLTHYYHTGTPPFRSLSTLPDEEALHLMAGLADDTYFGARFKDPLNYLHNRRRAEDWVRAEFTAKGGRPVESYPIYMVLGLSPWIERAVPITFSTCKIRFPLSIFQEGDVSFTYPDSMVSAILAAEKNPDYYEPDYHGKVFTLREILEIIEEKGLPGEGWQTRMPKRYAHYIEAQVWNHEVLVDYHDKQLGKNQAMPLGE